MILTFSRSSYWQLPLMPHKKVPSKKHWLKSEPSFLSLTGLVIISPNAQHIFRCSKWYSMWSIITASINKIFKNNKKIWRKRSFPGSLEIHSMSGIIMTTSYHKIRNIRKNVEKIKSSFVELKTWNAFNVKHNDKLNHKTNKQY